MKQSNSLTYFLLLSFLFFIWSCSSEKKDSMFTGLSSDRSGINFSNELRDNDSSFSFINEFGYMGGGVGIGDFNNDGLPDIFFTGNQVSSRLYFNKGDNRFEDVTEKAGLTTKDWCTGVSIADVNQDGFDDIYVCVFGKDLKHRSKNLLYINKQNGQFQESAAAYGLADSGYSTQAAFLDYDGDGDLDMYLANYLLSTHNANTIYPRDKSGFSPANDRLYRNDGDSAGAGHPVFSDQSRNAGIREDGYGLGVSVSDYNSDGWPDIYVANDFVSNDLLWKNNKDGSFTNIIASAMRHQSYSSMGSDAADLNNDGLPDLVTLDMLPETNERKKTSYSLMNYERYESERTMGFEPEFMRNMLQLNNGNIPLHNTPFFSETGRLNGIHATDWSWSVLLADFNNDGRKDMHITNGVGRDFINADFLEFSNNIYSNSQSNEERQISIRNKLSSLDNVNLSNYLYMNRGDSGFADISASAGIDEPSMSNGAAYADLDNDGDLDLVTNNINKPAFVFINNTINRSGDNVTNSTGDNISGHHLRFQLKGAPGNLRGFGTKLFIYQKERTQLLEQNPVRGYFSSVDQTLLCGLGSSPADSAKVIWPDGKTQLITGLPVDTTIILSWKDATVAGVINPLSDYLFKDITGQEGLSYVHRESPFNDYVMQRLLPQKYSQLGPFITTADINGDGGTDFFIGGAFNFSGSVFKQNTGQSFTGTRLIDGIKYEEDQASTFFDADDDGDMDLLVTGGGMQYEANSPYYRPRLYLNNGKGVFSLSVAAIAPQVNTMAGCVAAADYDGDGDQDLFIGGRISFNYPNSPRSYILRNDKGIFTDVTATVCPSMTSPGMLTSSVWTDFDKDGKIDLVIAGEWMPIRFFRNQSAQLVEVTASTGLTSMNGMWRSLAASDIDNDGDIDFIAGNLGLNCEYKVSPAEPMQLFATDLDGNGSTDPFFFYYIKNSSGHKESYPASGRGRASEQVPALKKKFLLNKDYARAEYKNIFDKKPDDQILKLNCDETRTCYIENLGNGKFRKQVLPVEAQYSAVNAIICEDLDGDGIKDLLLAGNEYQAEVMTGSYDASYGCFLKGAAGKPFKAVPSRETGLFINGDVKDLAMMKTKAGDKLIIAAVNNDSMRVFRVRRP